MTQAHRNPEGVMPALSWRKVTAEGFPGIAP